MTKIAPLASVTTIERFDHSTVIGGVQSGWKVAVAVTEKFAFPFCTGKSPPPETVCLFAACGFLLPGLMQAASPETVTWICVMLPRPATLPDAERAFPEVVRLGVLDLL